MATAITNRLRGQTSPYLLQHADNPVHWQPWDEAALALARELGRPILLSIGYSACHWCHVMAHESFEDEATAALMNRLFVNIKVDREERPDLDRIYQTAHQLLTRRGGGWPLTMFLTPEDQLPFFGATYFPREPRHGLPGFKQVLERVAALHESERQAISEQNAAVAEALQRHLAGPEAGAARLDGGPLADCRRWLGEQFDARHGGFGPAPKFPHPTLIERLLREHARAHRHGEPDEAALAMALTTLRAMARGGLQDQLGGGFYRYATDDRWLIPHFEKMLYDNGPLLALYADAFRLTGAGELAGVARATADWLLREMRSPQGGFYSSLDADAEGGEGSYYLWRPEDFEHRLAPEEARAAALRYGLTGAPNFEGRWHLHAAMPVAAVAEEMGRSGAEVEALLASARQRLLAARGERPRPPRDEKILTSWNALAASGLAAAARALEEPRYAEAAEAACLFLDAGHRRDGRLLASSLAGSPGPLGYLDDHAFLLQAALDVLELRWRGELLQLAISLADALLAQFACEHGGFYFTAHDHEPLVQRPRTFNDESLPNGNGVAAAALQRLGHLLGERRYLEAAAGTLAAGWEPLSRFPGAHNAMLVALEEHLEPPETVIIRGDPNAIAPWAERALRPYAPQRQSFAIPAEAEGLPALLAARQPGPAPLAYLCEGHHCEAPCERLAALAERLARSECPRPPPA